MSGEFTKAELEKQWEEYLNLPLSSYGKPIFKPQIPAWIESHLDSLWAAEASTGTSTTKFTKAPKKPTPPPPPEPTTIVGTVRRRIAQ